jgi:hypothetical protein
MLTYHFPVSALQIPGKTLRIKVNNPKRLFERKWD